MVHPNIQNRRLLFDGNSLSVFAGGNILNAQRYPTTLYNNYVGVSNKLTYFNYAVSGKTTPQLTSNFSSKFGSMCRPTDILIFWEIINDAFNLPADTNGTQLYADVVAYCNQAKATGVKLIVLTGIATDYVSADATINNRVSACNTLIRNNYLSFCDAIADVGANAAFDTKAKASNTTYYDADKLHLTNVGYDLIASIVKPVIDTLL